jgi:hypothetical protein
VERVTFAFTTTDLQSHGFDLNESRPRVVTYVWPDNGWFSLRCGLRTWPAPDIFAGFGVIVGPSSLPRIGPFMYVSAYCRL